MKTKKFSVLLFSWSAEPGTFALKILQVLRTFFSNAGLCKSKSKQRMAASQTPQGGTYYGN